MVKVVVTEYAREPVWGCAQRIVQRLEFATREEAETFCSEHNAWECPPLAPGQSVPDLYYKAWIFPEVV